MIVKAFGRKIYVSDTQVQQIVQEFCCAINHLFSITICKYQAYTQNHFYNIDITGM